MTQVPSLAAATVAALAPVGTIPKIVDEAVEPADFGLAADFLRWRTRPRMLRPAGKIAVHLVTRAGILFAAAIFALLLRTNGGATSMRMIGSMLDFGSLLRQAAEIGFDPGALRHATAGNRALLVATLVALLSPNTMQIFGIGDVPGCPRWIRWRPSLRWGFASGMLLVAALAGIAAPVVPRTFIYADI